jgi:hypothetical protein
LLNEYYAECEFAHSDRLGGNLRYGLRGIGEEQYEEEEKASLGCYVWQNIYNPDEDCRFYVE